MNEWLAAFLAIVLPAPEREAYERRTRLDVPFWSFLLGCAELAVAFFYNFENYFVSMREIASGNAMALGQQAIGGGSFDERLAYNWSGVINVLAWFIRPDVLFFFLVALVGVLRIAAFFGSREAIGEPLAYLALRLSQVLGRRGQEGRRRLELGPDRPDRLVPGGPGELLLLSARERADWQPGRAVEIGEIFYRIAGAELKAPDGETAKVFVYRLVELPANELIRGLVAYERR